VIGQEKSRHCETWNENLQRNRNLQMLKKVLEKSTQFWLSEQPYGPKSLNVSLKIAGV